MRTWKIWIDTGGTFTDCLAYTPQQDLIRAKVLSSSALRGKIVNAMGAGAFEIQANWNTEADIFEDYAFQILGENHQPLKVEYTNLETDVLIIKGSWNEIDTLAWEGKEFEITAFEEAPILAARVVTQTPLNDALPPMTMRLGSTKGTNALLERKGAKVGFLVTKGFGDLLEIGTQQRPDIFSLNIVKPKPLYHQVIEIEERVSTKGEVIQSLSIEEIQRVITRLKSEKIEVVAIALLHSYAFPKHELLLKERLEEAGINFISCSSELAPSIKILPRAETAVINAYLAPIIENYLASVQSKLEEDSLKVMTSAGGIVGANFFKPKDSLLSGPAGGVVGAAKVASLSGVRQILTLDMGGTSTDVSHYNGKYDYQFESKVGDANLFSHSLAIETVAAGGGSLCSFDGFKLTVGPESAGANPGPASYGAGGGLTITDVNLLLGRIDPQNFGVPLNLEAAQKAFSNLLSKIEESTRQHYNEKETLEGLVEIANEKMAEAIQKISVRNGYDPEEYSLLAFGGAGGQHACQVAELLNMKQVLIPYDAGLLSAYGMGQADIERFATQQVLEPFQSLTTPLESIVEKLTQDTFQQLEQEGYVSQQVEVRMVLLYLRFQGQDATLEIVYEEGLGILKVFQEKYQQLFGHWVENQVIELESVKVISATLGENQEENSSNLQPYQPSPSHFLDTEYGEKTPVFLWEKLEKGATIEGKALLVSKNSTTVIEENWQLKIDAANNALVNFEAVKFIDENTNKGRNENTKEIEENAMPNSTKPEAVQLELFTNRFSAIAHQMGALLERTAFSVNVKERLDFSCAILDAEGKLLVNAPHIPVHLGSLGICTRLILENLTLENGDVVVTNHPKFGGSHLPDITLVAPVYTEENELIGYVANRAHHSELGGKRPGSMPPDAKNLAEEGVVILPTYLVKKGQVQWEEIKSLLTKEVSETGEKLYPTRSLNENLADLNAALASVYAGANGLQKLCQEYGLSTVHYYMKQLKSYASDAMQKRLLALGNQSFSSQETLDDGTPIQVQFEINEGRIKIDFSGSGKTHPQNLNANPSIVNSALIYVLRLLIDKNIPLNEGIMENVEVHIPEGFLNPVFPENSSRCPAVVGGNTETSQRVVDTLLKGFGLSACSQGTMNNLLFGNEQFGYYETIGGGTGAGNGFHGKGAVHQHMTNTRITDPEIMEFRYPVRLEKFAIRQNSGGIGKWKGGNGITRHITFLEPVSLTVLTQHRKVEPYGLEEGEAGQKGEQYVIRKDGTIEPLQGIDGKQLEQGDQVLMHTPGGGGYGKED